MPNINVISKPGTVTVKSNANIRSGAPSRSAPAPTKALAGESLAVLGIARGESVEQNDRWYVLTDDRYIWSGACTDIATGAVAPHTGPKVHRRADGSIRPLGTDELNATFTKFGYTEAAKGRINIDSAWVAANIIDVKTPILTEEGYPRVAFHRKAAPFLTRVFGAIAQNNLQNLILSCAGTFVPRHKGWDPKRDLSAHSWGVAIDLNAAWNPYGHAPAAVGAIGSVRKLVPFFEAEGFAWGGHFSSPFEDGMHFELARLDV